MNAKSSAHNALLESLMGPRFNGKALISPDVITKISAEISQLELHNAKMSIEVESLRRTSNRGNNSTDSIDFT